MKSTTRALLTAAFSLVALFFALSAGLGSMWAQTPTSGAATATPSTQVDIAAIQQRHIDALNSGDVAGALSYLTDDATSQGSAGCITPCVGKAAIQREYENEVATHTHVTRVNYQVSGSTITGRFEVTNDVIRAAGVDRVAGSFTVVFTGDKISSQRLQIDTSDPQTAKFLASLTAKPPATGSGGYLAEGGSPAGLFAGGTLIVGVLLFAAGLVMTRKLGRREPN